MRTIKFRAWDKKGKKMRRVDYLGIGPNGYFCVCENQNELDGPDECEVEQFTGLTDKDGKEIWEGDIVRWWWEDDKMWGPPAIVRFGTLYEGDDTEKTGWIVEDCFLDSKCTVIGTIHDKEAE